MTQRKIHHIFKSNGQTGKPFRYIPKLSIPFDLSRPVLITEKVDGSTMQAYAGEPYKRYDRLPKGSAEKFSATEEERYKLEKCSRDNPAEKHYFAAWDKYADKFKAFGERFPNSWLYFEALGSKVSPRYGPDLAPTIRVFDSYSMDGSVPGWDPFPATKKAAAMFSLPVVFDYSMVFETVDKLMTELARGVILDQELRGGKSEGWVLRQGSLIGKIREKDLSLLEGGPFLCSQA